MRVQFSVEGGLAAFPGLSKPVTIDSGDLSAAEAARLEQLVGAARFFDLPAATARRGAGASAIHPDQRQYTITVQDGARRHTARLADPVESEELQALVDFLQAQARAQRAAARGQAGERKPGRSESDRTDD